MAETSDDDLFDRIASARASDLACVKFHAAVRTVPSWVGVDG